VLWVAAACIVWSNMPFQCQRSCQSCRHKAGVAPCAASDTTAAVDIMQGPKSCLCNTVIHIQHPLMVQVLGFTLLPLTCTACLRLVRSPISPRYARLSSSMPMPSTCTQDQQRHMESHQHMINLVQHYLPQIHPQYAPVLVVPPPLYELISVSTVQTRICCRLTCALIAMICTISCGV
jgi:hypothetical protein